MKDVDEALWLEINRDCKLAAFAAAAGEEELSRYLVDRAEKNTRARDVWFCPGAPQAVS